ncbi:uncharacterized protein BP5553_05062 [Venustampulla echinocandica]|uniref:Uncharacterized protein n=1 Tax=Venustampulla echinocandica TaxID=2656787 RepID=A0A370TQ25_9HELO|nr:uncharacterized protein BP5553_05062 [Venustampulla echinocandica]RDL37629.1 hypothetical protein BP5553_05062 [Venustampulla echinocandica]
MLQLETFKNGILHHKILRAKKPSFGGKSHRTVGDKRKPFTSEITEDIAIHSVDITKMTPPNTFTTADPIQHTEKYGSVLPIPELEDSLDELVSKLAAIINVIRDGKSISEATAYLAIKDREAENVAMGQMGFEEKQIWTCYINGNCKLPDFNWEVNQLPPPTSKRPLKKYGRRAEALNRLYKTDQAHEGHMAWITQYHASELLPIVKAIDRVIGAERNLTAGHDGLSATKFADLQSINLILRISGQICKRAESIGTRRKISEAQALLASHRRRLQAQRMRVGNQAG